MRTQDGFFWLVEEYFPEIAAVDRPIFPTIADFTAALGSVDVRPLPIPHDCRDGFLGAYCGARTPISTRA